MNTQIIIEILGIIGIACLGFAVTYFKTNAKLNGAVGQFISEAEETFASYTKSGGAKFNFVVDSLYGLIPLVLKPFIPRAAVEYIVQTAFDEIQKYATKQLDKAVDKAVK